MTTAYIGIDCAPGAPRPDRYIKGACELIGAEVNEPTAKLFGAWQWTVQCDAYDSDKLKGYFDALCEKGRIRGAEWGKGND